MRETCNPIPQHFDCTIELFKEETGSGNILLGFALSGLNIQAALLSFYECEDNVFFLSFYTQNHLKPFDTPCITASQNNEATHSASAFKIYLI